MLRSQSFGTVWLGQSIPYDIFIAIKRLENKTSPFPLVKQMGTSVEMLEKYYGPTSVNATTVKSVSKGNQKTDSKNESQHSFD
jgi:integrase